MNEKQTAQSKGGEARKIALSPEERSDSARLAALTRHHGTVPKATHTGELDIQGLIIPCARLDNGERVISDRSLAETLGVRGGGAYYERKKKADTGAMLPEYISAKYLEPFITDKIRAMVSEQITYTQINGASARGIKATALPEICDIWVQARQNGALKPEQYQIADKAYILLKVFASIGLFSLIDEATGFQYDRPRRDLEEQLKKFLSEELRKWVRTFPADYFKHLCRLRGVELRDDMKLPMYFGTLTNNLVYRRIAPCLLKKLKERKLERGHKADKLFSWLSEDIGLRALLVHLGTVVGFMKVNTNYDEFEKQLNSIAPIYPESPGLFDDPKDWEEPK
jgi:P63C domain